MRQLIPAMALITISAQCIFNGFMLSVLLMPTKSSCNLYGKAAIERQPPLITKAAPNCLGGVQQ
jgi:hypothetical protein